MNSNDSNAVDSQAVGLAAVADDFTSLEWLKTGTKTVTEREFHCLLEHLPVLLVIITTKLTSLESGRLLD